MSPHVVLGRRLGPRPHLRVSTPSVEGVFEFIVSFKRSHDGNAPTVRDIVFGCGISSTSVADYYLDKLVSLGLISRPRPEIGTRPARSIEVIGGSWKMEA